MARHKGHSGKHYSPIRSHRGSGPTSGAGHIESVMGTQFPPRMKVRESRGGTGHKRAR